MSRNLPYRKYRPVVHVHKNARVWYENAFTISPSYIGRCLCLGQFVLNYNFYFCHFTKAAIGYVSAIQVEVCHHRYPGGGCKASSPYVVMAAHSSTQDDGEMLPGALQDQDHLQETQRGASQATRGGTAAK